MVASIDPAQQLGSRTKSLDSPGPLTTKWDLFEKFCWQKICISRKIQRQLQQS